MVEGPIADHDGCELSVDELAREAGTTVRNVRLYQERGLLPPPRREGRRGRYGPDHLRRLRLVLTLLGRGYPITAIRELLEAWEDHRSLGDVLGFEEALAEPFTTAPPREVSLAELAAMFPAGDPVTLLRAIDLGVVRPEDDHFSAPAPALFEAGTQLAADGVPMEAVLDAAAAIRAATDDLAEHFVGLFREHVWQPFVDAGMPPGQLPRITEALRRQRPLATQAVVAALADALRRHTDAAAAGWARSAPPASAPSGPEQDDDDGPTAAAT
ncbi:MAG: MerR family transcriptional regulator, partial [Acidimicrobiales bacterium]